MVQKPYFCLPICKPIDNYKRFEFDYSSSVIIDYETTKSEYYLLNNREVMDCN